MPRRVHILGASGSGTSTLGRALAQRWQVAFLDSDDFFWEPTDPPYQVARPREDRIRLLQDAIAGAQDWILSGSACGWGDVLIPAFDLVVFLHVPTEERLKRLAQRETARFGAAALAPGGIMHDAHVEFLIWASSYDEGPATQRSRALHESWMVMLPCPVLRLDGRRPLAELVTEVERQLGGAPDDGQAVG